MFKNYQQAYVTKELKYSGIMKDEFSFLQNGNKLPYLMLDSESREYFQADLAADKTALAVLKKEFGLVEAEEQEEMFVGCRYGNLDYRADLIEGKLMPDAPRCGLISTCPGFNVICRIPLAPRGGVDPVLNIES